MAAEPKISDDDLVRLRHLFDAEGWTLDDLAKAFGITSRHVRRLVNGERRAELPKAAAVPVVEPGAALVEVDAFLDGMRLRGSQPVLAATARALAVKLDECAASSAASSAQAMPRVAAQLVEVLGLLNGDASSYGPDRLDEIRDRRAARRRGDPDPDAAPWLQELQERCRPIRAINAGGHGGMGD